MVVGKVRVWFVHLPSLFLLTGENMGSGWGQKLVRLQPCDLGSLRES